RLQLRRIRFLPLPRYLRVLVSVLGVARRAARLLHVGPDHRDDRVVGESPLTRTIIVQNVTKPKLALLHQLTPERISRAGKGIAKGEAILAELVSEWQPAAVSPELAPATLRAPPARRAPPTARSIAASVSPPPTPARSRDPRCQARTGR